jgi:hypothetical protein
MSDFAEHGPRLMWELADNLCNDLRDKPPESIDDFTHFFLTSAYIDYDESDDVHYAIGYVLISGNRVFRNLVADRAWAALPVWEPGEPETLGSYWDDKTEARTAPLTTAQAGEYMHEYLSLVRTRLEKTVTTPACAIDNHSGAAFEAMDFVNDEGEPGPYAFYYGFVTDNQSLYETTCDKIVVELPSGEGEEWR